MDGNNYEDFLGRKQVLELPPKALPTKVDMTMLMKTIEGKITMQYNKSDSMELASKSIEKYAVHFEGVANEQKVIYNGQKLMIKYN